MDSNELHVHCPSIFLQAGDNVTFIVICRSTLLSGRMNQTAPKAIISYLIQHLLLRWARNKADFVYLFFQITCIIKMCYNFFCFNGCTGEWYEAGQIIWTPTYVIIIYFFVINAVVFGFISVVLFMSKILVTTKCSVVSTWQFLYIIYYRNLY